MEELIPAEIKESIMVETKSTSRTQKDWFVASKLDKPEVLKANSRDLAFFHGHNDSSWTNFNHCLRYLNPAKKLSHANAKLYVVEI